MIALFNRILTRYVYNILDNQHFRACTKQQTRVECGTTRVKQKHRSLKLSLSLLVGKSVSASHHKAYHRSNADNVDSYHLTVTAES